MDVKQLLQIIRENAPCSVDFIRLEPDTLNLNEYGQVNRQHPVIRGRDNFTLTLDQDGLEALAKYLTDRYGL